MKITVLAENTARGDLPFEHGLSLYIEARGKKILFDTGQSSLFAENAEKLGVDLTAVDFAVLSHGHYDHGGGIKRFLEINKTAPVYLTKGAFAPHYNAAGRYIGIDAELKKSDRLIFCGDETAVSGGLALYTCNDREKITDMGSFGLTEEINGIVTPDPFLHEQYLLITEKDKRVLISGCSHKGVINLVEWFKPDYLIGGFHFSNIDTNSTLALLAKRLDSYMTTYYTCHCTGEKQYDFMKKYMPRLDYISTGMTVEI